MSAEENNNPKPDWSIKDLTEVDQKNFLGFFGLLYAVDKRKNPHLYEREEEKKDA